MFCLVLRFHDSALWQTKNLKVIHVLPSEKNYYFFKSIFSKPASALLKLVPGVFVPRVLVAPLVAMRSRWLLVVWCLSR